MNQAFIEQLRIEIELSRIESKSLSKQAKEFHYNFIESLEFAIYQVDIIGNSIDDVLQYAEYMAIACYDLYGAKHIITEALEAASDVLHILANKMLVHK